jgi:hypothetical protein
MTAPAIGELDPAMVHGLVARAHDPKREAGSIRYSRLAGGRKGVPTAVAEHPQVSRR